MKAREYPLEREWCPLYLFYSSLRLNPIPTALISYFLTAARSQVRFDVSIIIIVSRSCWQNQTSSLAVSLQKSATILVLSSWLKSRPRNRVNWHQKFFHWMMSLHHASACIDPLLVTTYFLCGSLPLDAVEIFIPCLKRKSLMLDLPPSNQESSILPYRLVVSCNCWFILTKAYQVVLCLIISWSLIVMSTLKP
jgi:hypothetical protein